MISGVVALPFFDRIFILLNTIYFMGVHQVNVRAYYKRLADAGISEQYNDYLFYLGLTSCISLPLIGVFDCHNFRPFHYLFAGLFFLSAGIYSFSLANLMHINKSSFPPEDEFAIDLNHHISFFMLTLITILILCLITMGSNYWLTPVLEWSAVLLNMNYFSFLNFTNPFYNSIHPYANKALFRRK